MKLTEHFAARPLVRLALALALALPLIASLFLSGCATALPELSAVEHMKTDGYVVVRLVMNAPAIGQFAGKINAVYVTPVGAKGDDYSYRLALHGRNMYSGWAPAGNLLVQAAVSESVIGNVYIGADKSLSGTFAVVAGQVTDLQTLIYQPVGDQQSIFIPVAQSGDVAATVSSAVPEVATQLLASPVSTQVLRETIPVQPDDSGRGASGQGLIADLILKMSDSSIAMQKQLRWTDAKSADDLIRMAKQSTTNLNGGYFVDDGSATFGSTLGQVLIRKPDGSWRALDTGRLDEVNYVVVEKSAVVAAMDDGSILISTDDGTHWHALPISVPVDPVVKMFRVGAQDYLLVGRGGAWGDFYVDAYRLTGLEHPNLTTLKHIKLGFDNLQLANASTSQFANFVVETQGQIFVAEDDNHIDTYDIQAGTWSQLLTPGDFWRIKTDNDGKVVTIMGEHGIFSSSYITRDAGQHWEEFSIPTATMDVHFLASDYALGWLAGINTLSTTDSGKHWSKGPKFKKGCSDFFIIDRSKEFICVTEGAKILSSKDGSNWVVERSSY